jgi:putative DNA primase/helicase
VPQDKRFNEQLLKGLTGGDSVNTRRMYQDEWEFVPTSKLFFCGNSKPIIMGLDDGIWRRVRLIPWTVKIPDTEVDPELETKLEGELPGILSWAVRGCAAWQAAGLGKAQDVEQATAGYREESDPLSDFFKSRCEFGGEFRVARTALRRSYEQWCNENGATAVGPRKLGDALRRRSVVDGGSTRDPLTGAPVDAWCGVRVRAIGTAEPR